VALCEDKERIQLSRWFVILSSGLIVIPLLPALIEKHGRSIAPISGLFVVSWLGFRPALTVDSPLQLQWRNMQHLCQTFVYNLNMSVVSCGVYFFRKVLRQNNSPNTRPTIMQNCTHIQKHHKLLSISQRVSCLNKHTEVVVLSPQT